MRGQTGRRRLRTTVIASAVACVVGIATLTGCGPVNAGTSAADQFDRDFADVEGVSSAYAGGSNNLPFTGSVEVTVNAEPGLSDEGVDALAAEIAEYMRTHAGNVDWYGTLVTDRITVGIVPDDAVNEKRIDVARPLLLEGRISNAEVGVRYGDASVLVTVDGPEALVDGYLAASAAAGRLGVENGRSGAAAVTDSFDFTISDEARDGEDAEIGDALAVYSIVSSAFTLVAAEITPDELRVRAGTEEEVPALRAFIDGIPAAAGLTIDVQGGMTTSDDASRTAAVVSDALVGVEGVVVIKTTENLVNVTIALPENAEGVLDAIIDLPEFAQLDGFGLSTAAQDFRVFDDPAGFADTLTVAQAGYGLPGIDDVDVSDSVADGQQPTARFRFTTADEKTISTFASTMKPHLTPRGWHTFVAAGGEVEWFIAADPLVLDDPPGGRSAEEQRFADMLVRVWDAVPG